MLVVLGIILVMHSSLTVDDNDVYPGIFDYQNTYYLRRTWW